MELGSLVIVGALVSLLVQGIKKLFSDELNRISVLACVILISLGAATFYVLFKDSVFWEKFVEILMAAGAVYAFIIKSFERKPGA